LNNQHSLEDPAVDQRYAKEGLICVFSGIPEILESRMILDVADGDRLHLFGDQSG
jgi:hypothetical protein